MKIHFNSRYNTIAVYAIIVFAVCLLLILFAFKFEIFSAFFSKIIGICSPIIWGFVIAYLLNPLVMRLEGIFGKLINRKKEHKHIVRALSVGISIILLLAALAGLIASIIPEVISNIQSISDVIRDPNFIRQIEQKIRTLFDTLSDKMAFLGNQLPISFENTESFLLSTLEQLELSSDKIFSKDGLLASLTNGLMSVLNGVKNAFLGIIISIYLLYSKEVFLAQGRKFVCALFQPTAAQHVFHFLSNVNKKFISYFTGVAIDCTLMGVITFIFMSIMDMPYAILISMLLALTNAIPIFGPFIGSIPAVALMLLFSPGKALIFLIFIVVIQQVDGNIIAPKILGDQLGLSAFWIMTAVFIGGGLFGFVGMIIASPMFAVIYSLCSEFVSERLDAKGMPSVTAAYMQPVNAGKKVPADVEPADTKKEPPAEADGAANEAKQ